MTNLSIHNVFAVTTKKRQIKNEYEKSFTTSIIISYYINEGETDIEINLFTDNENLKIEGEK